MMMMMMMTCDSSLLLQVMLIIVVIIFVTSHLYLWLIIVTAGDAHHSGHHLPVVSASSGHYSSVHRLSSCHQVYRRQSTYTLTMSTPNLIQAHVCIGTRAVARILARGSENKLSGQARPEAEAIGLKSRERRWGFWGHQLGERCEFLQLGSRGQSRGLQAFSCIW